MHYRNIFSRLSSIATTNFHNQFGFVHIMFYFYSTLIEIILISATVVEKTIFSIKGAVSIFIIFIFSSILVTVNILSVDLFSYYQYI